MRLMLPAVCALAGLASLADPELFQPGVISTGDYELNAAFSPSGDTLLFTKSSFNHWSMTVIEATRRNGQWRLAVPRFSGRYNDVDAIFDPGGKAVYFISDRPTVAGDTNPDFNIWRVAITPGGYAEPELLPEPLNSPGQDYYPSVTREGTVYFSSQRQGQGQGRFDIFRASKTATGYEVAPLGPEVNYQGNDIDVFVDPAERFIVFASYGRPDDLGGGDLYVSFRAPDGTWSPAANLGPSVNSIYREYCPILSPDGEFLYFTSERRFQTGSALSAPFSYDEWSRRMHAPGNGSGDIYRVRVREIPAFKGTTGG